MPLLPLVYLDHNVLDDLIKLKAEGLRAWLIESPIIPVVSNTNLTEIDRSKGYEDEFFSLLDQINARFIEEQYDERYRSTDRAIVYETNISSLKEHMGLLPFEADESPVGFSGLVYKLLGGQLETPIDKVLQKELDAIKTEYEEETPVNEDSELDDQLTALTEMAFNVAKEALVQLGDLLNSEMEKPEYTQFQQYRDTAPRFINNLEGENLIDDVISEANKDFGNIESDAEDFLKTMDQISNDTYGQPQTLADRIRSLYMLLTLFGYQRDPNVKKEDGYRRDMRDLEHVVMARFCRVFFTKEKRLIKKANQIYRYLNLATLVVEPSQHKQILFRT